MTSGWLAARPCPPLFEKVRGGTPAQRAGLRYEQRVKGMLEEVFADAFVPGQWFAYEKAGRTCYCQVDGYLRLGNIYVLFEAKYSFNLDCLRQLDLYPRVLHSAFAPRLLGVALICRNYDPAVRFATSYDVIDDIERWVVKRDFERLAVFPWRS